MTEDSKSSSSGSEPSADGGTAAFERVDWDEFDRSKRLVTAERVALVVGLLVVAAMYYYFQTYRRTYIFLQWSIDIEDWLLLLSIVVLVAYGVVPLAKNPAAVTRVLRRMRGRLPTTLSLGVILVVLGVSTWMMLLSFEPSLGNAQDGWTIEKFQPPVGFSAPYDLTNKDCLGQVTGDIYDYDRNRLCQGTMEYPLGTDNWGYDMRELLVAGAQPFVYLSLITVGLIVPLATVVGIAAGYYGGLVDDLLMSYVDVQLSVPAIVLYMVSYQYFQNSMFMLVIAFGLLSWGGIARIVRSETLQRTEEGYITAAQAIGAHDRYLLRRHVFPNITNTVVPATFHLIAILVLTEAGLAFIGFQASFQSWGMTISEGVFYGGLEGWWNSTLPAVVLGLLIVSLKTAGDGFRDMLDPRGDT